MYLVTSSGFLVFPARERTISPADLQGILGMMAYDQRTGGGARGFPPFFSRGFTRGASRQVLFSTTHLYLLVQ